MITSFQAFPINLSFRSGFKKRRGFLLYAKNSQGKEAWAEASPLPGFSQESWVDVKEELVKITQIVKETKVTDLLSLIPLLPSVDFGLRSLMTCLQGVSKPSDPMSVCALISGPYPQMLRKAVDCIENGYEHIKVKVSHLSDEEAKVIIDTLLGKARLKVDVNRAWSLNRTQRFFSAYSKKDFEYIEEPVSDPKELKNFDFPIGLDETLREPWPASFPSNLKALVVKPMLIGGQSAWEALENLQRQSKAQVVFSSSYESGVGLYHLCLQAYQRGYSSYPIGVGPYKELQEDILQVPHRLYKGQLYLSPLKVKKCCYTM